MLSTAGAGFCEDCHRQTCFHSYRPVKLLKTFSCQQLRVPIGGIVGGFIGAMLGGSIGHTRGGQIGGISSALEHKGTFFPFIQVQ
jgi:outer membrane lipoprotein SlyB